jgi:hypothetical protein
MVTMMLQMVECNEGDRVVLMLMLIESMIGHARCGSLGKDSSECTFRWCYARRVISLRVRKGN